MRDPVKAQFEVLDERFRGCRGDRWMEWLHTGCRWTEGPAYFPAGRYLVFSDIPNDRILRWDETTGAVGVFRQPAGYANGHTVDRQGRLVSCEQGAAPGHQDRARRVGHRARRPAGTEAAQQPQRHRRARGRLALVHRPELRHRQRLRGLPGRQRDRRLSRVPARPGHAEPCGSSPTTSTGPNGLAFSADERQLYIADSRRQHIRRLRGDRPSRTLTGGEVFATCDAGSFDGIRLDAHRPHLGGGRRRAALLRPGRHAARQAARPRDRGQLHVRRRASATSCSSARPPRCTRSWSTSTAPATRADPAGSPRACRTATDRHHHRRYFHDPEALPA